MKSERGGELYLRENVNENCVQANKSIVI